MEKIYVFDLRCYHSIGRGCPIECYREEGIDGFGDYDEALKQARKEFRRRNTNCDDVDDESIEVLHYENA
jgi:hypothetical protein